jgi:hypothetical protein
MLQNTKLLQKSNTFFLPALAIVAVTVLKVKSIALVTDSCQQTKHIRFK